MERMGGQELLRSTAGDSQVRGRGTVGSTIPSRILIFAGYFGKAHVPGGGDVQALSAAHGFTLWCSQVSTLSDRDHGRLSRRTTGAGAARVHIWQLRTILPIRVPSHRHARRGKERAGNLRGDLEMVGSVITPRRRRVASNLNAGVQSLAIR
jgi:hypothetical protein